MEIDRTLIGSFGEPFVIEVEAGAIRRFAEAIGDPHPLYREKAYAQALGFAHIVAPPTFAASFRPPVEPAWTAALDRRRVLAGEQRFTLARPIVAGDVLACAIHFVGVEDKSGRSGAMEVLTQHIVGRDSAGVIVFTHERKTVYLATRTGAA